MALLKSVCAWAQYLAVSCFGSCNGVAMANRDGVPSALMVVVAHALEVKHAVSLYDDEMGDLHVRCRWVGCLTDVVHVGSVGACCH